MFDSLFPKHWTTLQRLMWLKTNALARAVYETITGNPVSFTTVRSAPLKQLSVAFSPKQDLNGYDSPWPAGGGKNLFNPQPYTGLGYNAAVGTEVSLAESTGVTVSGNQLSYAVEAWAGKVFVMRPRTAGNYNLHLDASAITNPRITIYDVGGDNKTKNASNYTAATEINAVQVLSDGDYVAIFIASNTAQTITISDPQLEAGSSFTSFAPYSNLCPISGWSSLTVEQRGKNLFDKDSAQIADGWWYAGDCTEGEPLPIYAQSGNYHTSAPIPVVAAQTYTVVGCGGGNGSFLYLDKDMNYLDGFANSGQSSRTFTVPNNPQIAYLRFPFATSTVDTCQLELGSTATVYVPYNGRSISISLGSTVYSGYYDVVTGQGEVTMGMVVYSGAESETWEKSGTAINGYYIVPTGKLRNGLIYCPFAKQTPYVDTYKYNYNYCFSDSAFCISLDPDVVGNTVAAFKTWLSNNPMMVVYELATPIHISLTPQEINSLAGDNVMWTDADSLTAEYRSN